MLRIGTQRSLHLQSEDIPQTARNSQIAAKVLVVGLPQDQSESLARVIKYINTQVLILKERKSQLLTPGSKIYVPEVKNSLLRKLSGKERNK